MSLNDDLDQLEKEVDPQIAELRKALLSTQKELAKVKLKTSELVEATHKGAFEACWQWVE